MAKETAPRIEITSEDLATDSNDVLVIPDLEGGLEGATPSIEVTDADVFADPIEVTSADVAPTLEVTSEDVAEGPAIVVGAEDVAETSDNGLTTGLEDIGVKVSTAARAYREDGKFLSQNEVDVISANQDRIREGMTNRDGVSLKPDVDVSLAPELDVSVASEAPVEAALVGESTPLNKDRLSSRSLDRVAGFLADMSGNLAERRTASQVVSEIGDKASGAWESAKTTGAEQAEAAKKALGVLGRKAGSKLVEVVTAPSRGADRLFDAAERGMDKIEARAKSAQERKTRRLSERRTRNNIRRITKNAERNMRDRKALQKETARNQEIAAKREVARQKAEAARKHRADRKAKKATEKQKSMDEWAKRTIERKERVKSKAKKVGRGVVDSATTGFYAASDKGSEVYGTAKTKARAKRNKFYSSQAAKAADKAERYYNKTAGEGETVVVKVDSQRSEV